MMSDPQALLRALHRRLEARASRELAASRDGALDDVDREIARVRAIAYQAVAEEVLLMLTEPTPEERA